jgi:uncharacterized protein (TIGR03437 family)
VSFRYRSVSNWINAAVALASAGSLLAQPDTAANVLAAEWRTAGNLSLDRGLPGFSTGPIARVWYSPDGATLYAAGLGSRVFETTDFEQWTLSKGVMAPPPASDGFSRTRPDGVVRVVRSLQGRAYAAGRNVHRSDDDGSNWTNLTEFRGQSILGDTILDLAASPRDPDEITVASRDGIWRSLDGGQSWVGLNDGIPNFPGARILSLPAGTRGMRIASAERVAFEWQPGERKAWRETPDETLAAEQERHARWSRQFGIRITASATVGETSYVGAADGRIFATSDRGATWRPFKLQEMGAITRIVADPQDPRIAVATAGDRPADLDPARAGAHVLRTVNGGSFWDDLTADLPDRAAFGVAFERSSGALYAATSNGLYFTTADLNGLGPSTPWKRMASGWPDAAASVLDVQLSPGGHQVYAAVESFGIFAAAAPHRKGSPRLVHAADYSNRAAAPGSLLTLLGAEVSAAQTGSAQVPVLASTVDRSEIQVPFHVQGNSVQIAVQLRKGTAPLRFGLPLQSASPAIFLDRDGGPMLLDASSGVLLDALSPARPGARIQILASGLGRVSPEWPAGVAAPLESPPSVVAKVRASLDGVPVEVTRAVLAPGYIGFYLVEIELPAILNSGPAELFIETDGRESNRVRLYVEQ